MLIATAPSGQDVKQSFTSLAKRDDGASALSSRLGAARSRDARRASDSEAGESLQALSSSTTSLLRSVRPVLIARNQAICSEHLGISYKYLNRIKYVESDSVITFKGKVTQVTLDIICFLGIASKYMSSVSIIEHSIYRNRI